MATKHENHEILVIIIKRVNHPRTPKQWAVAHENAHKTRKYEFWVMPSNIYQVLTVVVNHRGITKLCAITHDNVYKHENDEFLVMPSNMYRVYWSL